MQSNGLLFCGCIQLFCSCMQELPCLFEELLPWMLWMSPCCCATCYIMQLIEALQGCGSLCLNQPEVLLQDSASSCKGAPSISLPRATLAFQLANKTSQHALTPTLQDPFNFMCKPTTQPHVSSNSTEHVRVHCCTCACSAQVSEVLIRRPEQTCATCHAPSRCACTLRLDMLTAPC